jgi:hypothetical protein
MAEEREKRFLSSPSIQTPLSSLIQEQVPREAPLALPKKTQLKNSVSETENHSVKLRVSQSFSLRFR